MLYDKFAHLVEESNTLLASGLNPFGICIDDVYSATQGRIGKRDVVMAGNHNYLGLTFNQKCISAGQSALAEQGTGTTDSRMANGSYDSHLALEADLAAWFNRSTALVFSGAYTTHLGIIGTLATSDTVVLLDADCHASLYDACLLGGAQVIRFHHNDVGDLERQMRLLGERAREALIIVEGIYSMSGDVAPLAEIAALKRRLGGYLLVDEAHSFGVMGAHGRGLAEATSTEQDVDIILGTFSTSLAATGGFAVGNKEMDVLRYSSRPHLFTASPSPATIATVRCALRIIAQHPELRTQLWSNAHQLYRGLQELGYSLGPQISPVVPVMVENKEQGLALWRGLITKGVYVNLVLPPVAPAGMTLLRCCVNAAHTPQQIDQIIQAFAELK